MIKSILIALPISVVLSLIGPWYLPLTGPLLCGLLLKDLKSSKQFLAGLCSIGLLYIGLILYHSGTVHADTASRIGQLFGGLSTYLLGSLVVLLGGIYGGLAQWCGHLLRRVMTS